MLKIQDLVWYSSILLEKSFMSNLLGTVLKKLFGKTASPAISCIDKRKKWERELE